MEAVYKRHQIKPTTPAVHFKCAFCGKEGVRRASKVKNPNLIFCDNHCQMLYKWKQKEKKSFPTIEKIKVFIDDNLEFIHATISGFISKTTTFIPYRDLECEAMYLIGLAMMKNDNSKYIIKSLKFGLKRFYFDFVMPRTRNELRILDTLENSNIESFSPVENFDFKTTELNELDNILSQKKAYCYQILRDRIKGYSFEELADKYKTNKRDISVNLYNATRMLKLELNNENK